jgi:hypothetical protein
MTDKSVQFKSSYSFANNPLNTPDVSSSNLHNLLLIYQEKYNAVNRKSVNYQEQQNSSTPTDNPLSSQISSFKKTGGDFYTKLPESSPSFILEINPLNINNIEKASTSTSCVIFSNESQPINDKGKTSSAICDYSPIEVQPLSESNNSLDSINLNELNKYLRFLSESCQSHIDDKGKTSSAICDISTIEVQPLSESNNSLDSINLNELNKCFRILSESCQSYINDKGKTSSAICDISTIEVQPLSEPNKPKESISSSATENENLSNDKSNESNEDSIQSIEKKRGRHSSDNLRKQKVQKKDEEDYTYFGNRRVNKRTNYNDYKECRLKNNEAVIRCRNKKKYEYDEKEKKLKELTDQNKELEKKVQDLENQLNCLKELLNIHMKPISQTTQLSDLIAKVVVELLEKK